MSGGKPLPISQCEPGKINQVQFEVFKAKQVKSYAVCCVTDERDRINGKPAPGGLSDLRMGTTDFAFRCETCHMQHPDCPGHFGYIELAEPVFNLGMFEFVLQTLRCVCQACGALLSHPGDAGYEEALQRTGPNRLRAMVQLCQGKHYCDANGTSKGCGQEQVKVSRPPGLYPKLIIQVVENDQIKQWYGEEVAAILDRVSDEDARVLGFDPDRCHPRDLLITVLPVPPPAVRPSVSFGSGSNHNELTVKLLSILKTNNKLRELKNTNAGSRAIGEMRDILQEHVATYFNNGSTFYKPAKMSTRNQLKSITQRLKGKYGRIRGNLMGKRVDFSARTVITGDPCIDVDEIGVPFSVAMTLTFPERVNRINRKRLTETVRRREYPSANYIFQQSGSVKKLSVMKPQVRDNLTLEIGDIVERHVLNGDCVLFNRQPTLHRMSMMGHRVRVLPFSTFRLNLSCTTPYNADFDGDEMNLHVPQSLLTKAELQEMMMVPKNFVSPNKSAPCMGIVQDSLLGCFRITDKETFLDKAFMQNIAMWVERWDLPIPAILKPEPLWTGKQVFSMVLPPECTVIAPNKKKDLFSEEDDYLVIRRGKLLSGLIKKNMVGTASGSLIHVIFNERGSDEVAKFINHIQRTTAYFLYNSSFSVGVADCVADKGTLAKVQEALTTTRTKVGRIAAKANHGSLTRKAGMTLLQSFEKDVNNELNDCRNTAASLALSSVKRTNRFRCMIEAGSKGSDLNICQIAVMVGQQNVNGSRIPFQFRRRTLPHFLQDDFGEKSRGMVNRGFIEGLTPEEFFFHTMGGREGLIDTAVKTADTGYLQRKLIKALEDTHAAYDGTVRNANRDVIQFMYGEDGLDGQRIEAGQKLELIWKDNKSMETTYRYEYAEDCSYSDNIGGQYITREVKKALRSNPESVRTLEEEYEQLLRDRDNMRSWVELDDPVKVPLPFNLDRAILGAMTLFETQGKKQISNLNPVHVIRAVQQLIEDVKQFFPTYGRDAVSGPTLELNQGRVNFALKLFSGHLRSLLASKRVIKEYRLSDKAFEFLLGEIRLKYQQSIIQPGEMVGAMAAQSCGEPATQMTLNTFHNAGISSKNVTLGVPRLVELLNVSKTQKNSSMQIALIPQWAVEEKAQQAVHMVEYCTLESMTTRMQIYYDPDPRNTVIEEDKAFVTTEWDMALDEDLEALRNAMSPWVVRLELDHLRFNEKLLDIIQVKAKILSACDGRYFVEISQHPTHRVVRLRLREDNGADAVQALKDDVPPLLSKVHLRGIQGVKKVFLLQVPQYPIDSATGAMEKKKVWALDTEGTALKKVFSELIDSKGESIVDHRFTSSNNIPEIFHVFGIEAARRKLFLEMRAAYQAYSVVISYRHYSALVDIMCHRGHLMAVNRVGINRSDAGPLMRCSFEETVKVLMGAAAFGMSDPVRGLSANLILGNQARVGTGLFDLVLDTAQLRTAMEQEEAIQAAHDVDIYHGFSSVVSGVPSVMRPGHMEGRTPLVTDMSVMRNSMLYPSAEHITVGDVGFTPMHVDEPETQPLYSELSVARSAQSVSARYEVPPIPSSQYASTVDSYDPYAADNTAPLMFRSAAPVSEASGARRADAAQSTTVMSVAYPGDSPSYFSRSVHRSAAARPFDPTSGNTAAQFDADSVASDSEPHHGPALSASYVPVLSASGSHSRQMVATPHSQGVPSPSYAPSAPRSEMISQSYVPLSPGYVPAFEAPAVARRHPESAVDASIPHSLHSHDFSPDVPEQNSK